MSTTSTTNIAIPEPLRAYVAERVESGQYGNTSKYVRDLIRKDQREQRVQRLRDLVEEGLASGPASAVGDLFASRTGSGNEPVIRAIEASSLLGT